MIVAVILIVVLAILAMDTDCQPVGAAAVLFLGKFVGIKCPLLFLIVPFLKDVRGDRFPGDHNIVHGRADPDKRHGPRQRRCRVILAGGRCRESALEVKDYKDSISLASQTALRDVIGKTIFADMLTGREAIDAELQRPIGSRVSGGGIKILSVEIRDVVIPGASRTPCPCRRRRSASKARAISGIPNGRLPRSLKWLRRATRTTLPRFTCGR